MNMKSDEHFKFFCRVGPTRVTHTDFLKMVIGGLNFVYKDKMSNVKHFCIATVAKAILCIATVAKGILCIATVAKAILCIATVAKAISWNQHFLERLLLKHFLSKKKRVGNIAIQILRR